MKEQPNQRKQMLYYCGLVMIVMLLLNIFVFPALLQPQVTEKTYDEFVSMVDSGAVEEVSYQDNMLVFTAKEEIGRLALYKTGVWPGDDALTERLLEKGVKFAAEIPTQASPLFSFLISFVLPMAAFALLGRWLMNNMTKR